MVKCSKLHPPPDKDGNCKEGYYIKNNKCCYKIKKPLKKKQQKKEIQNVKKDLQETKTKLKELKKEIKDIKENIEDDNMDKKEEVPKNINAIKKRTIRELKNGKKKDSKSSNY
jgi:5-bromo-4-chloroindolyl phosphate hydrolysis protein